MSGGQRQRLAIARVMLKQPAIVLLDEATSERLVLEALERLLRGRTSVIIAHRTATIRNADHIVMMHEGQAVGEGTHETLLRSSAMYRSFCLQQSVA